MSNSIIMPRYKDSARVAIGNIDFVLHNQVLSEDSREALGFAREEIQDLLSYAEKMELALAEAQRPLPRE